MMTSDAKTPRPPYPLGKSGQRLWREVHRQYSFERHEVELLIETCRTLDTIDRLEQMIAEHGMSTVGSTGQVVVHPAVLEARLQRALFGKLLAQLGLPDPDGGSTVKSGHQARSRAGHRARWASRAP